MSLILDFVKKNNGVSIKEIAAVVRGCSEKTIQRELGNLIEQGLIEEG
jgi:DeoR/GlpR family transcriptional regulator of sugar metabolism